MRAALDARGLFASGAKRLRGRGNLGVGDGGLRAALDARGLFASGAKCLRGRGNFGKRRNALACF